MKYIIYLPCILFFEFELSQAGLAIYQFSHELQKNIPEM